MQPEEALLRIEGASSAIYRILQGNLDLVPEVAKAAEPAAPLPPRETLRREAFDAAESAAALDDGGDAAIRHALRRVKYRVVGALLLRDLAEGPPAVPFVTAVLADLADALVDGALRYAELRLARAHGRPSRWPEGGGGLVAVAMGKHGGRELNYSSDVDLVFVCASRDGDTVGPRRIPAARFADRLVGETSRILADRTGDGFCFRVDLDLRPDGAAGPPSISLVGAEQYYLSFGRTWERAAWLKARPCAGDMGLGEELFHRIEPFRFRRSLDFGTLEDLAAMRDRIARAARQDSLIRDLKRGPGGIRELEFLVQALQLLWAGRDAGLRVRGTMEALDLLARRGALPRDVDPSRLAAAWRLLRATEHRLQWPEEAQTQMLPPWGEAEGAAPADVAAWQALARAFGYGDEANAAGVARLRAELAEARAEVSRAWAGLMLSEDPARRGAPPEQAAAAPESSLTASIATLAASPLVDPFATGEERRAELHALGFPDPDAALPRIERLHLLPGSRRMAAEAARRFERVAPELVGLAARSADPLEALARVEAFLDRVGARGATWLLLQESDGVREALVRLFAESAYLSDLLISHPELLDALVLRGRGGERPPRGLEELTAELLPELAARRDAQDAIIALRTFQVAELLRIGLCELSSALPAPGIACPFLSSLGGACVRGADFVAVREMRARHGEPLRADGTPLGRAILALGSLGSGWMTWGSDLDLAFVFEDPEAEGPSGPRDPRTWMPRWAQRVVTGLSTPTPEGRCYGVDLRLRPESGGAPVVVGISGFAAYYRERARPWERIALCRASVVAASDPGMAQRLHATLEEVTRCSPGAGSALVAEAREMRRRQQVEIARESDRRYALKTGTGGLSDVEFAVACLQMTRDPGSPSAFEPDPLRALHTLRDAGAVSPAEHAALAEGYCFLRRAEARLRLRAGQAADALEFPSAASSRVAAALGFPSADALAAGLRRTRASVAAAAGSLLRRAEAGGAA